MKVSQTNEQVLSKQQIKLNANKQNTISSLRKSHMNSKNYMGSVEEITYKKENSIILDSNKMTEESIPFFQLFQFSIPVVILLIASGFLLYMQLIQYRSG